MRVLSEPVRTYTQTLGAGVVVQPSQLLPNFGPVLGLWLDLTVSITGGTASEPSNTIDNVLSQFLIDDQFGKAIFGNVFGTDITILNDILTPRGVRQNAPTITTNSAGAGSAEWYLFLPITISAKDMPANLKLTFAATSSLQNASLTSAGTVSCTLVVRSAYAVGVDQPTLRTSITNPPHQQGDNALAPYLPLGLQIEALAVVITGGDGDFSYVTIYQSGATITTLEPIHDFTANDVMLMQSGHETGELIFRVPVFVVDSTTVFTFNLSTDSAIRLYSLATIPQKNVG